MKKFFTLLAMASLAVSMSAQDVETWEANGEEPENLTVSLTSISAEFLNNTSKGSTADAGTWDFSNAKDVRGDQNGLEIKFTPTKAGELKITFAAKIATNKSVNMFLNNDATNTIDATRSDGTKIVAGINLDAQTPAQDEIASDDYVTYNLNGGIVYNFYVGGTKWRLRSFSFTPSGETGIEDIVVDENAPVEYFNLQGIRVSNPENGLYIKRQGNKVEKVYVK